MSHIVDFNRHRPPCLTVPLGDEAETVLRVTPPTVELQEELRARQAELSALLSQESDEMREALYDLAARLMSCNRNMRKVTGEQLRTTYGLDEEDLVVFYRCYADFLVDIEHAKN